MIVAMIATYLLCFPVQKLSVRLGLLDEPGDRSSHTNAVPRTGGIAIILGALIGVMSVFAPRWPFLVAAGVGAFVALASLVDDIRPIPALPRLLVHIAVAFFSIWLIGLGPQKDIGLPYVKVVMSPWVSIIVATIFVAGFVNFFNFMDGINGIAATQGMAGGVFIALLLRQGGSGNSVFTAAALAGACGGFLPHNAPKARMFMGDTGATTLGFGLAMLALIGGSKSAIPWIAFLLPLSVFIYDPAFTVIKRIIQGHNPMKPHREFHFHLLIRSGWSHAKVMRSIDMLILICGIAGWLYARGNHRDRLIILSVIVGIFASCSILVHCYFREHQAVAADADAEGAPKQSSGPASEDESSPPDDDGS